MIWIATFITVQALDVWTTKVGLAAGFTEGNPFMVNIVNDTTKLIAAKAAVAIGIIVMVHFGMSGRFRQVSWTIAILVSAVPVLNNAIRLWA
jgi:hypothetical protein